MPSKYFSSWWLLSPEWLCVFFMCAVCVVVVFCPVFPSQDGPMHRYYVHILETLLRHTAKCNYFQIRKPFPPYATHYALLLALVQILPYDAAEKVLVCIIVFSLGLGLLFSSNEAGDAGRWVCLVCTPLLLPWCLMKGFFNFTLGVGLVLIATAFWQRLAKRRKAAFVAFCLTVGVLAVTHPVPLLLLILLCGLDLVLAFSMDSIRERQLSGWLREHRLQLVGLTVLLLSTVIPAQARDRTQTHAAILAIGFHMDVFRGYALLYGLSPYSTRARGVWINAYRACLYGIFCWAMVTGGLSAINSWKKSRIGFSTTAFIATVLLGMAIPFLPNNVNGSSHFADRLIIAVWCGALLSSAGRGVPDRHGQTLLKGVGVSACILTIIPAYMYFVPIARDLRVVEQEPLPNDSMATLLVSPDIDTYERGARDIAFDPYRWAPALSFSSRNIVLLDPPWIGQKITPIQPRSGSPLYIAPPESAESAADASPSGYLPSGIRAQLAAASRVFVYIGPPAEVTLGLAAQLPAVVSARFRCDTPDRVQLACIRLE